MHQRSPCFNTGPRLEYEFQSSSLPGTGNPRGIIKCIPALAKKQAFVGEVGSGHQSLASQGRPARAGSRGGIGFPPLPWLGSHAAAVPLLAARGRAPSHSSAPPSPLKSPFLAFCLLSAFRSSQKDAYGLNSAFFPSTESFDLLSHLGAMMVTLRAKTLVEDGCPSTKTPTHFVRSSPVMASDTLPSCGSSWTWGSAS